MNPKICGVLAIRSVQEVSSIIKIPQLKTCDLIELRLDFFEALDTKKIGKILKMLEIPIILTFRSHKEGGQFIGSEGRRLRILKKLIQLQPDYIDLEMHINEELLCNLTNYAQSKKVKIILSTHFFENTPKIHILTKNLEFGKEHKANVIKVISFAKKIGDNDTILALNKIGQDLGINTVAFCMGSLGFPSRIFCVYWGAVFTYGSLNKQIAPGQLSVQVMRKFYELLQERDGNWK